MEPHPTDWRHSHQFQTYEQQEYERQQMNSMQLSWNNQLVHPVMQQNNQIYPALTSQVSVHAQAYPHQDYNSGLNNELAQQDQTLVVPQNNFSSTGNSSAYLGTDYLDQQPAFNTEQQAPQNMAQGNQSAILYNGYSSNSAQPMNMSPIPHINEGRNFGSWNQSQPYEQANTTVHKSSSSGNILPQAHQIHHGCEMLRQPLKPQCSEASMSGLPSTFLFGAQNVIQARPRVVRNSSYSDTSSAPPVNTAFVQHTMPAASQPALSAHTDPTTLGEGWNASVGYSFGTPMQYSGHNHNASGPSHGNMQPHLLQSGLPQSTGSSLQSHSSDSTASNSLNTGSTVSVHAEARRGSLFTQPMHHESSTTLAHNLKRRPSRQTESLDDNLTSRSVSSSIPSTPDLSRQQSRSSIRSPSTEYSQVQGSFPPPTDGQTLAVDSLQIDGDDQPIPDLTAVHLEEKTSALNTWARLPPRPKNDDEANAKLR